jgi:hypothetical protein
VAVIDEKGRLFGKVNLLDLVVVIAVVAVVARFGYQKVAAKAIAPAVQEKTAQVEVRLGNVQQFTMDVVKEGDVIQDSKSNTVLGKVITTRKQPSVVMNMGPDGRFWESKSSTYFDYFITIEGPVRLSDNGFTMSGIEVKVGRPIDMKTAFWAGTGVPVTLPQR